MDHQSPLFTEFPEFSTYSFDGKGSREDLEDMLSDPNYFQAVFHTLPQVKDLLRMQAELGGANEELARTNMEKQEKLYGLRSETKAAFDEAKALEARQRALEKEQREVFQRFTPQFLLMRLRHATTAQDDASEALASSFIQSYGSQASGQPSDTNGKDVDDFIKEFKESRKIYHKRVIWGDRWNSNKVDWPDDR